MSRLFLVTVFALLAVFAGAAIHAGETEIPLDEVPEVVMRAAMEAVPGIELVAAEIEECVDHHGGERPTVPIAAIFLTLQTDRDRSWIVWEG
jgi:hypothetical protein